MKKTEFEMKFGMTIEAWRKKTALNVALDEVKTCAEKYYHVNWMDDHPTKKQKLDYHKKKIIQAGNNYRNLINN